MEIQYSKSLISEKRTPYNNMTATWSGTMIRLRKGVALYCVRTLSSRDSLEQSVIQHASGSATGTKIVS